MSRRFRLKPAGYAVLGVLVLVIVLCVYAIARAIVGGGKQHGEDLVLPSESPDLSTTPEIVQTTTTPAPPVSETPVVATQVPVTPTPVQYTPAPTKTPEPKATERVPTSSEKKHAKAGELTADGVNLRAGPSTSYDRIGNYNKGATMAVYATDGDFYFVKMDKDGKIGFMSKKFVNVSEEAASDTPKTTVPPDAPDEAINGKVTAKVVALRSGPNKTDKAITELSKDDVVYVYYQVGEFYYVQVATTGKKGFAYASYISAEKSVPTK